MATTKRKTDRAEGSEGDCWFSEGRCLEIAPAGVFGYIYLITNKLDGRIYVGKKQFTHRRSKRISKRAIKATKTRKRVNISFIDSGWINYWGSSKTLLSDIALLGKENFSREVLYFCNTKSQLSYWEVYYQIQKEVLFRPSYNGWISCRIFKNKL